MNKKNEGGGRWAGWGICLCARDVHCYCNTKETRACLRKLTFDKAVDAIERRWTMENEIALLITFI